MLMKSEVEIKAHDWPNALKTLEQAFELPGVRDPVGSDIKGGGGGRKLSLPFG
jgi:hypothetical protein